MKQVLNQFDARVTQLIASWPSWLHGLFVVITTIGHPVFAMGVGLTVIYDGYLKANTRLVLSGGVVLATSAIGTILKYLLARSRPLTQYVSTMRFDTFSFPSGHTTGSTVAYGLLAYLAWYTLPQPWNYIVTGLLATLIVAVGVSRVYLGAHFPSDVVAGWSLGTIGLMVIIFIIKPLS